VRATDGGGPSFRKVPRTGVIYVMTEAARRGFRYGHPEWVNLGQGAPETGDLPGALERITRIELAPESYEYAPVDGLPALKDAVAQLYNARYRRGLKSQYSAENVAISSGGRAGLTRIAACLGGVHLGHLLPDYTAYEELLDVFRAFIPIPIVLDRDSGFSLSADRLRNEIVGKGLGAMLLSNPCNPTGHLLRGGAMRAWVEQCRELHCWLVLDEFYAHYLYGDAVRQDGPACSAARWVEDVDKDPVVVVDGLTKNWRYPGFRLSWTVGPKDVIERVASAASFLDGGPPHPLQRAVLPLLEPAAADQEARAIQAAFGAKRELVVSRVRGMGLGLDVAPTGSFYAFVSTDQMPENLRDGHAFFLAALDRNVIVVPGEFFDVNPGRRRSHIPSRLRGTLRISFGPDMESVQRGLDRLDGLIRSA